MSDRAAWSLRSRFLSLVAVAVVLPLGGVGWWLTRSAVESQVVAVTTGVEEGLAAAVRLIHNRWISARSHLLDLGEEWLAPGVSQVDADREERESRVRELLSTRYRDLSGALQRVALDGADGTRLWEVDRARFDPNATGREPAILVQLKLYERISGNENGTLEAEILMRSLLDEPLASADVNGLLLAAIDLDSGASLLPLPFDPSILGKGDRLFWGGGEWVAVRQELSEPPVGLVAMAPLTPAIAPLEQAARRGLWLLLGVAVVTFALVGWVTRRLTRSLERLADAAADVSRGDLDLQVAVAGEDEVGQLGQAFNLMTRNLRTTLRELARRETLAAVGELAASLSHEVRNILTSVKLDLQRVEEVLLDDSPARAIQRRALSEVSRLDSTVTTTLQMARGSRFDPGPVDLRRPIAAAVHAARPEIERRSATFHIQNMERPLRVTGEADGLEQVFLNLLLNAAQALDAGGRVEVRVAETVDRIVISVIDDGMGITNEQRTRLFEPFYSTREEGTGLGLPVAQRIVRMHDGEIVVESTPGTGTTVRVVLPLSRAERTDAT